MNGTSGAQVAHSKTFTRSLVRDYLWVFGFSAATAIAAQIEIPHSPVPFTMQTLVVLLSGAFLGKQRAALSQIIYLAVGALGLPVFSQFGFGLVRLLGPTGGYLLSFPAVAFVVGYMLERRRTYLWTLLSMTLGLLLLFAAGTVQLYAVYYRDALPAFLNGFLIFSWWDLIKLFAASSIAFHLRRYTL